MGHKRYCEAISEMKDNTWTPAKAQSEKIRHMVEAWGWPICSLDGTETIHVRINRSDHEVEDLAWQRNVRGSALNDISEFCSTLNDF